MRQSVRLDARRRAHQGSIGRPLAARSRTRPSFRPTSRRGHSGSSPIALHLGDSSLQTVAGCSGPISVVHRWQGADPSSGSPGPLGVLPRTTSLVRVAGDAHGVALETLPRVVIGPFELVLGSSRSAAHRTTGDLLAVLGGRARVVPCADARRVREYKTAVRGRRRTDHQWGDSQDGLGESLGPQLGPHGVLLSPTLG